MEQELNFREELQKARKVASRLELRGNENEIDAYWDMLCGLVLVAEEDLRDQDREWEIAGLARELLQYARPLAQYDHMLDNIHQAARRMADALSDHPRLKVELLEFDLSVLERLDKDAESVEEVQEELDDLRHNIELADDGRFDEIKQHGLKHDPVEWTARWEQIIDEVDEKVYKRLTDQPRGMGFCHAYWHERANVLASDYGINWRSLARMNPRVMID